MTYDANDNFAVIGDNMHDKLDQMVVEGKITQESAEQLMYHYNQMTATMTFPRRTYGWQRINSISELPSSEYLDLWIVSDIATIRSLCDAIVPAASVSGKLQHQWGGRVTNALRLDTDVEGTSILLMSHEYEKLNLNLNKVEITHFRHVETASM